MKFFAVFAAIVAVAVGYPAVSTWTLNELSEAIQNPTTDPAIMPYLEQALDNLMDSIYAGEPQTAITVAIPSMDVTEWTLAEISDALQDSSTDPTLMPYLEHALNTYMDALVAGQQLETIVIVTPAGLVPVDVAPAAVAPAPAVVAEAAAPASSPLVQIIVNINGQQQVASPAPSPVVVPSPVATPEAPGIAPSPVNVVDQAPEPVIVAEISPEPVIVAEIAEKPTEVVVVATPDFNPVDIISPVMPSPAIVGEVVGPIV